MKKICLTAILFILFLVISLKEVHALPPPVCNAPAHTSLTDWGQQCDVASGNQYMSLDLIGLTTAGSEGSGLGFCQRYQDDTNYGKACPANHIDYVWKGPNGEHCKLYVDFCGYPEEASGDCYLQPKTGALIINWDARRCAKCQNSGINSSDPFGAGVKVTSFSALNNRLRMTAFYNPAFSGDPNDTRIDLANNRIDYMFILEHNIGGAWQEVPNGRTYLYGNHANYGSWVSCNYSNPAHLGSYRGGRPVTNHNINCTSTSSFPGIAFPFKGFLSGISYRVRTYIKPSFLLSSSDWNVTETCQQPFSITVSPTPTRLTPTLPPPPPVLDCSYKAANRADGSILPPGGEVMRGETIKYVAEARYISGSGAYNPQLIDTLPSAVTYVAGSNSSCTVDPNLTPDGKQVVRCNLGTFLPIKRVDFNVRVKDTAAAATYTNSAKIEFSVTSGGPRITSPTACTHNILVRAVNTPTPPPKTPTPPPKSPTPPPKTPTPPPKSPTPTTPTTACKNYGIREKSTGYYSDYGQITLSASSNFSLKRHFSCDSSPNLCNIEAMDNKGQDLYIIASNYNRSPRPYLFRVTNKDSGALDAGISLKLGGKQYNKPLWGLAFRPGDNSIWVANDTAIFSVDAAGNMTQRRALGFQVDTINWYGNKLYIAGGQNLYEYDSSLNRTWTGNGALVGKTDSSDVTNNGYLIYYAEGRGFHYYNLTKKERVTNPTYGLTGNFDAFAWLCGDAPIAASAQGFLAAATPTPAVCTTNSCNTWCGGGCEDVGEGLNGGYCSSGSCLCKPCTSTGTVATPVPTSGITTGNTLNFLPAADSYVSDLYASKNYGTLQVLHVDGKTPTTTSPKQITYLKYDLSKLSGKTITGAKLQVRISDGTSSTQTVHAVTNTGWSETGITYSNKPALGSQIASLNGGSTGTKAYTLPSSFISYAQSKVGTLISFAVQQSSSDGLYFYSRETLTSSYRPQLILTYK